MNFCVAYLILVIRFEDFLLSFFITMMTSCLRGIVLMQIDGVESLNNVLLIGMTNRKDLLDEALLRFLSLKH